MKTVVTGAAGFVGKHMVEALRRREGVTIIAADRSWSGDKLFEAAVEADFVFHLAGVNRPQSPDEFETGNALLTRDLCQALVSHKRKPGIVFTSSIQAASDNPYGKSKRAAEEILSQFATTTGASVSIFRLKNVFGKWCRPNYNSVTATFCHNIARGLPIEISDESRQLELVYIDDVVASLLSVLDRPAEAGKPDFREVPKSYKIRLGDLAGRIREFSESRTTLMAPDFSDDLNRKLYATYLSYLETNAFGYSLDQKTDPRGVLAEFIKSPSFGQVFVSRTKPGIVRGNHFHHTKTEKFMVVEGEAVIRFRQIAGVEVIEYPVSGKDFRVIDIPPGYTHSIENVGKGEMVTLFWACEIFDPLHPDTYFINVIKPA